ncbi:MAG: hypothetical protein L0332_21960 [Chloroflexi bacterium]|nr:hypothetical protein [Chloroflexota bacterium]MCI0576463.1 hypothetical protein [Chloroflexota bacterium]MCI0649561.1 hypothetical protein [Chloroflexota bacterium]MCI0729363.1 hypothetical protein [Chloroflexota bacterium]
MKTKPLPAPTNRNGDVPSQTWRWLSVAAVLVLLAAVAGISLISAGLFDPRPVGPETLRRPLAAHSVAAQNQQVNWLDFPLPAGNYSLRLTAAHQNGELDSAYGLAIGREERCLVAAVSPTGYTSLFEPPCLLSITPSPPQSVTLSPPPLVTLSPPSLLPWQPWPHVRPGSAENEIWLDVSGGRLTVRINRELLWQGEWPVAGRQVGLWLASYGEAATVEFREVILFTE